jgi:hypothetical protein
MNAAAHNRMNRGISQGIDELSLPLEKRTDVGMATIPPSRDSHHFLSQNNNSDFWPIRISKMP